MRRSCSVNPGRLAWSNSIRGAAYLTLMHTGDRSADTIDAGPFEGMIGLLGGDEQARPYLERAGYAVLNPAVGVVDPRIIASNRRARVGSRARA